MNKRWSAILIVVILVLGGGAVWYRSHKQTENIVHSKDPGFSSGETKQFEDQIKDAQAQLDKLGKDAAAKDKAALYMKIGVANYTLGRFDEAKKAYREASKLVVDNASPWHELYVVETAMQDYKAAKISIEKAVDLNNSNPQFWLDRISLMKDHFSYTNDQVDELYKQALDKTHNAGDVVVAYAKFLESKSDLAGAIKYWKMAIDANPANKQLYEQEIARIQDMFK